MLSSPFGKISVNSLPATLPEREFLLDKVKECIEVIVIVVTSPRWPTPLGGPLALVLLTVVAACFSLSGIACLLTLGGKLRFSARTSKLFGRGEPDRESNRCGMTEILITIVRKGNKGRIDGGVIVCDGREGVPMDLQRIDKGPFRSSRNHLQEMRLRLAY
jgi:hypothetical protein